MKTIIHTLLCIVLASLNSQAQTSFKVTGTCKDTTNHPLSAVNIALLKASDSSLAKAAITEDDGRFEITLSEPGNYLVHYTLTGFEQGYSAPINIPGTGDFNIPEIRLHKLVKELKAVTVSSKKPMIEAKADKLVFNVENSINATGSNALELLRKSPGMMVDNNENISMRGKNGVKIYIDGRMTQLDAKDLATYLKSINSNDIEAIEMISNPSAKFDASGNAGIVNIRRKKNKKIGTNGSVNINYVQGMYPKENGSVNLNHRDKKVNIFGNLGVYNGMYHSTLDLDRYQKDSGYIQRSYTNNSDRGAGGKAGIDYFISDKQTLGFLLTTNISDNSSKSTSNTNISNPDGAFNRRLTAFNDVPGSHTNNNINLNYKYADTNGRELNIDADYGLFRGRKTSLQPNYYYEIHNALTSSVINQTYAPTDIDIYTLKADYEQKLGKAKLGLGGKTAFVRTDNTFDFYNVIQNQPVMAGDKSNKFRYLENVNAAYLNYSRPLSTKLSMQAGLRAENTNSNGYLTRADGKNQADDTVTKSYIDLFPSAALTWNINEKNSLNLTYSRRIDRPTYQDLNPFENKIDELTYEKGNAFLRPQYSNIVELTHTFMGFVNTTLSYTHVHDYATMVTDTAGNASYIQQRNLATQQIVSLNLGLPIPIAKCCTGYVNLWYNYQMFEGTISNAVVKINMPSYGAYAQQSFNLGKDYSAEISGWYSGPGIWGGTWRTKPMGSLDLGAQKQFLHKNATIKLSITDVFFTGNWRSENNFGGLRVSGTGREESRTVRLSFNYRFGSAQIKAARDRRTGLEDEKNRIKGK